MSIELLEETAQAMVAAGKGIIAIDESSATCKKRFDGVGIECTEETRRNYRLPISSRTLLVSASCWGCWLTK